MLLLNLLSVGCQAKPSTELFTVKFEQKAKFPSNQSFSITQRDLHPISGIVNTDSYAGSASLPDDKPFGPHVYGIQSAIIESISWQMHCSTHLQVGYKLILTTRNAPLNSNSYSWLPLEVFVAAGWLLKSYWNTYSPLFNPVEQQEVTAVLTRQNQPFKAIAIMLGSGENQQPHQPSEPSTRQAREPTTQHTDSFTRSPNSDYDGGDGDPEQHQHTLGLNCFIHPCHGICQFRTIPDSSDPAEWRQHFGQSSCLHLADGYCFSCTGRFDSEDLTDFSLFETLDQLTIIQLQRDSHPQFKLHVRAVDGTSSGRCNSMESMSAGVAFTTDAATQPTCVVTVIGEDGQQRPCGMVCRDARALSDHKGRYHTAQQTCNVVMIGKNVQLRQCGRVFKNTKVLSSHKSSKHTVQKSCDATVTWENGQQRLCGRIFRNAQALLNHKSRYHIGEKICDVIVNLKYGQPQLCGKVCNSRLDLSEHKRRDHTKQQTCEETDVRKDGLQRPCGKVFKNARALSEHKRLFHSGQKTCDVIVDGGEDQHLTCGKVCKNIKALSAHKRKRHSGKKTCNVTLAGEDGQPRPCGKICKSAQDLSDHKRRDHSEQQTCEGAEISKDGIERPCRKVFKNIKALSEHKSRYHRGQQTCYAAVVGEDGIQRPCGKVCKNAQTLSTHKREHRKRKPVDVNQNDALCP